jgi:hypothetical protein
VLPGAAATLDPMPLLGLTLATLPVAALGVWDDLRGTSPWTKLLVQSGAALVLVWFGFGIPLFTNPLTGESVSSGVWNAPLTVLWVVAVINAINLIDGLDGLAAGVVLTALGAFALLSASAGVDPTLPIIAAAGGAAIGFLAYNLYPAEIIMGDTGSMFLGFVVGAIAISLTQDGSDVNNATVAGRNLAFSPDGRWLAFTEGNALKKVAVDGGQVVSVKALTVAVPYGVAWVGNDTILVGSFTGMEAVPANGGNSTMIGLKDSSSVRVGQRWPMPLPGNRYVAFAPATLRPIFGDRLLDLSGQVPSPRRPSGGATCLDGHWYT